MWRVHLLQNQYLDNFDKPKLLQILEIEDLDKWTHYYYLYLCCNNDGIRIFVMALLRFWFSLQESF